MPSTFVSVGFRDLLALERKLAEAGPRATAAVHDEIRGFAGDVATEARLNLSGRVLNVRSGRLRRGLRVRKVKAGAVVTNDVPYGYWWEAGHWHWAWGRPTGRFLRRPWLAPAFAAVGGLEALRRRCLSRLRAALRARGR